MNPKILLIAVLAVTGIIIMGGCIGEKEPETTPLPPSPEPQPPQFTVKELSVDEIIEKTKTAIDGTDTYEFERTQKIIKPKCIEEENTTYIVDKINKKISGKSSSTTNIAAMGIDEETKTTANVYFYDGSLYTDAEGFWIRTGVNWTSEDILGSEKNLLKNAKLSTPEKVNGKEAFTLEPDVNKTIFNEIFMTIGGEYAEEVIANAENVKVKIWISNDTFLPVKEYRSVETRFRGNEIKIEIETNFYNYNEPVNIEIPAESKTAVYAENLLKLVPKPEQVEKTINAMNSIKYYESKIAESIKKPDSDETADIDIKVDRENKKVMSINLFSIDGFPITEKIYGIEDKEYAIYEYESNETSVGKSWACVYSEWETQDLLKQLNDSFENTNVAVAEDAGFWLFKINATKEILANDFLEIAAVTKGIGTPEAEILRLELESNAKNIVVKAWVSKDTFLPVREELSAESTFDGFKMTIDKKIEFQKYNEPVTITLPESAESVECVSIEIC